MTATLTVTGLSVSYGGNRVVNVGNLVLPSGTFAGVVGANGAGKSTLINAIAGWSRGYPRVNGDVSLDGERIGHLPAHERVSHGLLLVPEGKGAFHSLTTEENLTSMRPQGEAARKRAWPVDRIYDTFPSLLKRRTTIAGSLSGGERQMLAIGRALRMGPRVLLLDEPSIGLAPRLILTVLRVIRSLVDEGLTVLLVEQNVQATMEVADHLLLLERGQVIANGDIASMRGDPRIAEAYLGTVHS
jgi:branched-chain amino acid transport system ATP-binding protein